MKALEQLVVRARVRVREGKARAGMAGRPARLSIRLDDLDAPTAIPATTLELDDWFDAIVRVVEWTGALPVTVVGRADHRLLCEIVRFAHRLECPTTLRTSAAGMTQARADELVDCGLERVAIRAGGVTDTVQHAVCGDTVADVRQAVGALRAARQSRGVPLDIALEVPFGEASGRELRALHEEARRIGVDGVRVAAPWRGGGFGDTALDALKWAVEQKPFGRTSSATADDIRAMRADGVGRARASGHCPVGGLRLELLPDGSVGACPFKPGYTAVGDAMEPAWAALAAHRDAIRTCDRACAHPDLTA